MSCRGKCGLIKADEFLAPAVREILIWFIFSGLIFCINAVSRESDEGYIRKNLKENLRITIFAEFLISTFTFNIWILFFSYCGDLSFVIIWEETGRVICCD